MKVNNENFDKVLNKLISSTRSPRGRFTAENSWKRLEIRLRKRHGLRRVYLRVASAAAVVLICMASWAAYQMFCVAPVRQVSPAAKEVEATTKIEVLHDTLIFSQQPLQEIALQLSETFHTPIRIESESLRNYRMTATFQDGESLTEILDLLKEAGNFTYNQTNDTITLTTQLN